MAESAYERLREEPFSLLLSDIVMPEMDGIELARRATELDPDLKVMFITGFAAVALNPDSEAPKDASVLTKPFHLQGPRARGREAAGGLRFPGVAGRPELTLDPQTGFMVYRARNGGRRPALVAK